MAKASRAAHHEFEFLRPWFYMEIYKVVNRVMSRENVNLQLYIYKCIVFQVALTGGPVGLFVCLCTHRSFRRMERNTSEP